MQQRGAISKFRRWVELSLVLLLLLTGATGPLLQSLDDDENLGVTACAVSRSIGHTKLVSSGHAVLRAWAPVTVHTAQDVATASPSDEVREIPFGHTLLAVLSFPNRN